MNALLKLAHPINLEKLDQEIRPFPATAAKIVSLCNDSDSKVAEITQMIECEPAVAVKLLAMSNSPLFGARREITSINHAIVLLGYRTVAQLALTIAAGPLFTTGDEALMDHRKALFRQSVGAATVSKLVAEKLNLANPSSAFLGGMMLDVGKLFFFDVVPKPYVEILDKHKSGNTADIELEVFGMDHPTIGNHCGQKWGLPTQINNVIKNHHMGIQHAEEGLTQSVLAGAYFSHKWNLGFDQEHDFPTNEDIEQRFAEFNVDEFEDSAKNQFESIITIFSI